MLIDDLRAAIAAVCPITSLTIGDPNNRSSWHIEFDPSATAAQQDAAESVLTNFVPVDQSEMIAAEKITAGITIASTSTPALNGIYAIDDRTQGKMQAVAIYILANNRFPAGQANLAWPDIGGVLHAFPSTVTFMAFVTAVADYVAVIEFASSQPSPTWPSSTVTIP